MSKLLELYDKRNHAVQDARAFLDSRRSAGDTLSADDEAAYDRMENGISALSKEIERESRLSAIEGEQKKPTSEPIVENPNKSEPYKKGKASDEYKTSFWNALRGRPFVRDALSIGTDSEGGYLVPDEYEKQLIEALEEENIFRKLANVIQTSSGERKIPVASSKGTAAWIEEGGTIPESNDSFGQVTIGAYKLGTAIKVSNELLNDSVFNIESYIAKEFARRIGAKEEESFFIGDGTGKPTGILANTGGAQVGVTSAGATAITIDEVMDLFHSLKSPYRNKAVFIVNDATVKTLRKIKDGNGQYLWQPSIIAGTPDTILNRPIYTSSYMPALIAGAKSVIFGDLKYYWIADRQGRVFQRLNELYATSGQVGFLATQRVDGKLILAEAVKVLQQHA
jgi:HK97 family phage major capsid protein